MTSRLSCIAAVALCLLFAVAIFVAVPRFTAIFEDFDTAMPSLTLLVINARIPITIGFVVLAVALVIKEIALNHRRKLTLMINLAFLVATGMVLAICSFGLVTPLITTMQSVK